MGSISGISNSLLPQSLFSSTTLTGTSTTSTGKVSDSADADQLSPLAQLLASLQKLQQTDPAKFKDVTEQIAAKLQDAAKTDTANGNTAGASQLTQLASDFTTASTSGQLPDIQDVAKSVSGAHHHHHGHGGAPPAYQTDTSQDSSANPLAIISDTLSASS